MTKNHKEALIKKLEDKTAHVAVLGLGYVGLPFAVVFAEAGFKVTGIDPDQRKVETIQRGDSHIQDVPAEQVKSPVTQVNHPHQPKRQRQAAAQHE